MRRDTWLTLGIFLVIGTVACAPEEPKIERRRPIAKDAEPCTPPASSFNVIGGKTIDAATFPFAKKLSVGNGTCSGTFVSTRVFITAGHCVYDSENPGDYAVDGVVATRVSFNPAYKAFNGLENTDMGILIFPEQTSRPFAPLAARAAKVSDEVTLVGFAPNSGSDSQKRFGTNKVSAIAETGMLQVSRQDGAGAISAPGDSGGTVLLEGNLVATMTGGDTSSVSELSHVMAEENLSYLRRIRDEEQVKICGLDGETCGVKPPAPPVPTPTPVPPTPSNPCL